MNWINSLKQSIDYIESHLTESITIDDIAKQAYVSPYYYQRMFMVLTNMSVQTYIRNRRLTLAAMELQSSDIQIIDLALKYQYESAEAFSRAFKKVHGKSPSIIRKENTPIQAFLKLTIQINLKGALPMQFKIETKKAFSVYGLKRTFTTTDGSNFTKIPLFWKEVFYDQSYSKMIAHSPSKKCLGICMPMNPDLDTEIDYVIGSFCDHEIEGYYNYKVPESEWAVFEVHGPMKKSLQSTWKRIYSEWFPQSNYEHAFLPEVEYYFEGDTNSEDYYMEIWIPVIKKEQHR